MKSLRTALANKKRTRDDILTESSESPNESSSNSTTLTRTSLLSSSTPVSKYIRKGDIDKAEQERLTRLATSLTLKEKTASPPLTVSSSLALFLSGYLFLNILVYFRDKISHFFLFVLSIFIILHRMSLNPLSQQIPMI